MEKLTKNALKRKKLETFENFLIFGSFWCQLKRSRNLHKYISHEAKLCELNSMGNTLKVKYIFGAWQIMKKFDLNIFLAHMKYGRKILNSPSMFHLLRPSNGLIQTHYGSSRAI